jgi:methionyl-tRNA synthetase
MQYLGIHSYRLTLEFRYHKIKGDAVFFTIGTDEHGSKIQKKAIEAGIEPKQFCDKISQNFKKLFDQAQV